MNVWMAARATGNPYMTLLVEHLERRGVQIRASEPQETITADLFRYGRPDILHLHWLNVFFLRGQPSSSPRSIAQSLALAGWLRALIQGLQAAGTRVVWTAHNSHNHEHRKPRIDRFCHETVVGRADAILAHSHTAKQMLVDDFGIVRPDKVHVIPHGHYVGSYPVEVGRDEARARLGLDASQMVFTYFGRIRAYKNIPALVDAFDAMTGRLQEGERDRAVLVVAGRVTDPALEDEIRRRIGGRANVIFESQFIPDEDVQLYMQAADVVVLPYREILTSGSAVLAMSFGRPVIAPRLGTLCDILDEQRELLYAADQPGEAGLTAVMGEAFKMGRERLETIGERNLEVAKTWDWPGVAEATHDVYKSLVVRAR